jgi:hypothetical protein
MIQDARLLVSGSISSSDNSITGQTVTGTDTTVLSTNTVDLSVNRDIGEGHDVHARIQVATAASGGTSVEVQVVTADNAALSTNLTVIGSTGAIPVASAAAGARFALQINPRIASKGQRYLGLRYVLVGAVSAGAYVGDFGVGIQDGQKFYPSGFAIL